MSERRDRHDWSGRRPAEGVRIIKAEEAQAALEAGEAAGRRPDDELRFGDVPPTPAGPRPPHRFPLPDSVDPASAVPRPPLAVPVHSEPQDRGRRFSPAGQEPEWTTEPPPGPPAGESAWEVGERTTELNLPPAGEQKSATEHDWVTVPPWDRPGGEPERHPLEPAEPPWASETRRASDDRYKAPGQAAAPGTPGTPGPPDETGRTREAYIPPPPAPPEEGLTVTGGGTELPHWSDPPTGEVPRIFIGEEDGDGDDLAAWKALGARSTRWRDSGDDWEEDDELSYLAGDEEPTGALNQSRSEHSDLYSFDEEFEQIEAMRTGSHPVADFSDDDIGIGMGIGVEAAGPAAARPRARAATAAPSARRHARQPAPRRTLDRESPGGDELPSRVTVGLGLIVLLAIAYAIGSKALVVLAAVIITAAAAESYRMLQRSGFRPATLLGLVGTGGLVLGAYWKGTAALPLVSVLVFGGAMLWYLLGIVEARPLANVAVTTMTFLWVGVLGSFSALMLRAHHGKGLFLGAVVVGVACDVAAFLVGRWVGSRAMAPKVSPGKTVEGFIGGLVVALVVGAIIGKELTPWGGMKHGLALGLIVGLIAPAGDLFESMIKRDLGVKDSGAVLGSHGGLLDRFDSLLLVLPAAYYLAWLLNIVR